MAARRGGIFDSPSRAGHRLGPATALLAVLAGPVASEQPSGVPRISQARVAFVASGGGTLTIEAQGQDVSFGGVGENGRAPRAELGEATLETATAMDLFGPDAKWTPAA